MISFSFATIVLHHAPAKVTSVLVSFVIFGGLFQLIGINVGLHKCSLAISVVFHIILISICCAIFTGKDSEVGDCGYEHIL